MPAAALLRPEPRRDRGWLFGLVVLGAAAAILLALAVEGGRARALVEGEDAAASAVRAVAAAEAAFHAREGRYGWLAELAASGVLGGVVVSHEPSPEHATTPGYRIDVLLPTGLRGARVVEIARRGEGEVDEELRRGHFAVVARPTEPGRTGWRTWYLDEDGVLYLAEGVADVEAALESPLPATQVKAAQPQLSARELLWQRADALFANP